MNMGSINLHYIREHQDRNKNKVHGMALLNTEADKYATKGLLQNKVQQINLPTDKAILIMQFKKLSANYTQHLRDSFSATQLHKFYSQKYSWSNKTIKAIWWDAHGGASTTFGEGQRATVLKYLHGRIACNQRESMNYKFRSPLCSTCGCEIEDTCHILQCNKCPERQKLQKKYIMELKDKLLLLGTNADTTQILCSHASAWLKNCEYPAVKTSHNSCERTTFNWLATLV
jgi:hypothetical protein